MKMERKKDADEYREKDREILTLVGMQSSTLCIGPGGANPQQATHIIWYLRHMCARKEKSLLFDLLKAFD